MHYVYEHFDPDTEEVVYIGCGSGGRAWTCGHQKTKIRSPEHYRWIQDLLERGFHPGEFVRIFAQNLDKKSAHQIEKELIHKRKPVFNLSIRSKHRKFKVTDYDSALILRARGASYAKIASELGCSTMTVYRNLNENLITMETALAERP